MRNYKKKPKVMVEDIDGDESMDDLAKTIAETLKEHQQANQLEPVELYSIKIQMKLHENFDKFRERFSKGYHLLLAEIEKDLSKK